MHPIVRFPIPAQVHHIVLVPFAVPSTDTLPLVAEPAEQPVVSVPQPQPIAPASAACKSVSLVVPALAVLVLRRAVAASRIGTLGRSKFVGFALFVVGSGLFGIVVPSVVLVAVVIVEGEVAVEVASIAAAVEAAGIQHIQDNTLLFPLPLHNRLLPAARRRLAAKPRPACAPKFLGIPQSPPPKSPKIAAQKQPSTHCRWLRHG